MSNLKSALAQGHLHFGAAEYIVALDLEVPVYLKPKQIRDYHSSCSVLSFKEQYYS